jgi:exodeoxyribonuclease VII small subunit
MTNENESRQTFEQALAELEKIVTEVEEGRIGLEESLQKYEKGMALIRHCREVLEGAEKRIETIHQQLDATPAEPKPPSTT